MTHAWLEGLIPVETMKEAANGCFSLINASISLSIFLSLFLSLTSINKNQTYIFQKLLIDFLM